jgi:chitinase
VNGTCKWNCDQKADCDPGGYGPEYVKHTTCPLNVCCSKYGFCGMTEEFCGEKKVKRPSCSVNGQGFSRVIGYYEGWSTGRPCNKFCPKRIPVNVYTHINFAFAGIDPRTFEVVPAVPSDVDLYKRLANLRPSDPTLKIFIAIGGWTFNDPGPTQTTFSDIARDPVTQDKFINSLIKFMANSDFNGVDLDWEYPVADDRSGRGEDYVNFPIFLAKLKNALRGTPGRSGLSNTLPASYY